ncbi:MAG: hypothetical protein K6F00_02340 [Lachnospiraceae bacterium]|nr:hypothetical protein [Lachnospiraceae bacterium]
MSYWDESEKENTGAQEECKANKGFCKLMVKLLQKFRRKRSKQVLGMITLSLLYVFLVCPQAVFASGGGAASVTASFNTLKDIVVALVTSVGTIVLLWGFFEWGTSLQSQEGVMQANAFKRIGGGLVMVLAPQLITAFVS